jgi:uncharacterized membrane protein
VKEIRQLDDKRLHWKANVAGEDKEWDAEITEQIPDKRIAWRSTTGVPMPASATFHKISDNVCPDHVQMDYQPDGVLEKIGDALGAVRMETPCEPADFKEMLESRGSRKPAAGAARSPALNKARQ